MIKVFIDGNEIKQSEKNGGVCGEHNSTEMLLSFGEDWAGYIKKVVFYNTLGFNPVTVLLDEPLSVSGADSSPQGEPILPQSAEPTAPSEREPVNREEYLIRIPGEALEFEGKAEYVIVGTIVEEQSADGGTKQIVAARKKSVDGTIRVRYSPSGESEAIPEEVSATIAEQLQAEAERVQSKADEVTELVALTPYIDETTGTWFVFDAVRGVYKDSGVQVQTIFTVNFNRIGYDEFISDKKFEEICEALDAGKTVIGKQDGYLSQLIWCNDNIEIMFVETQYGGRHIIYDMIPDLYDDNSGMQLVYAITYDPASKDDIYIAENRVKLYTDAAESRAKAYTDGAKIEAKAYADAAKIEAKAYADAAVVEKTKPFIVTITDLESGDFAASDKKVGEIYAAYQEGKEIIGVHGAYILRFISAIETECLFAGVTLDGKHIVYDVFDNDDNVGNVAVSIFDYATKTYVDKAIEEFQESGGSGEQEIFVVTCQASYIDETTNVAYPLTVDKSIKEIIDAINEGKSIRAVMFKNSSGYFLSSTTYRTMQRTYTEYDWDSGEDIEVPYDSVCFSFREPDSATVYEWIFIKTSGNIDGFWEVNVAELADKTYVDNAVQEATPVKGVDYWTEEDKAEIKMYVEDAILGGAW